MTAIYVDADACPVKDDCVAVAERLGLRAWLVCNGGLRPLDHPLAEVVFVPEGPDAADRWIAERAGRGDVVVTADIVLAGNAVAAGARVLRHDGEALTQANIGNALAMRDLMADLRGADPFRQGGGKPYGRADRARFRDALDRVARAAMREGAND